MYKIIELVDGGETETRTSNDELAFRMWEQDCENIGNYYNSECQLFFNDELISIYRHADIVPYPEGSEVCVQTSMTGRKGEIGIIKEICLADDGYPLQYRVAFPEFDLDELNDKIKSHGVKFLHDQNNIKTLQSYTFVEEFWVHGDLLLCPKK